MLREMKEGISFWQSRFGRFLRWVAFLPVGVVLVTILQALPTMVVNLAVYLIVRWELKLNFLTGLLAVVMLCLICPMILFYTWFPWLYKTPVLSCAIIAPNNKIASVIFGALFCIFQGWYLLSLFTEATFWIFRWYQLAFTGIVLAGTVASYQDEQDRMRLW